MTGGKVLAGTVAVVLALATAPAATQDGGGSPRAQETPRFRSSVDVVSVAAVVRDRKGRFVKDLSKTDFEVVESGVRRPILDFRAELNGPVKLGLLLDISGSMRLGDRTESAKAAARHLFATLTGGDQAAVYTFDTTLAEAHPFTSEPQRLVDALETVEKPFGQTSLYDAIAQTARMVADASSTSGRRRLPQRSAVVVITDGVDTRSRLRPSDVSRAASTIDVPVYIMAVVSMVDDPRANPENKRTAAIASDLQDLARGTGGDLFISSSPAEMSIAARQVIDELRHQYVLAFEASSRAGWRPLEVRTRQARLVVRARTGYSTGGPSS